MCKAFRGFERTQTAWFRQPWRWTRAGRGLAEVKKMKMKLSSILLGNWNVGSGNEKTPLIFVIFLLFTKKKTKFQCSGGLRKPHLGARKNVCINLLRVQFKTCKSCIKERIKGKSASFEGTRKGTLSFGAIYLCLCSINTATAQSQSKAQTTVVCMFPHRSRQLEEVRTCVKENTKENSSVVVTAPSSVPQLWCASGARELGTALWVRLTWIKQESVSQRQKKKHHFKATR